MRCRKAQQLVSARLDGELPAALEGSLADHLAMCPQCAAFARDLPQVAEGLAAFTAPEARAGFADRLLAKLDSEPVANVRPWRSWASPAPLAAALIAFGCGVALAVLADAEQIENTATTENAGQSPLEQEYGEALAEVSLDTDLLALLTDAEG